MGYTHYWKVKPKASKTKYTAALKDIKAIVESNETWVLLADLDGNAGTTPELKNGIAFNGIGENSHESFILPKDVTDFQDCEFCKTAQKPYDVVVTACLAVLAFHLGKGIEVSSDGDKSDWLAGIGLACSILNKVIPNPIKK